MRGMVFCLADTRESKKYLFITYFKNSILI